MAKVLSISDTNLESINLGNNKIRKDGAIALGKALTLNSTLKSLDLRLNSIRDEGCNAICLQVCKNKSIESLNLSGNGIGPSSASPICVLLRKNLKHFISWDLSSNKLANMSDNDNEFGRVNDSPSNSHAISSEIDIVGKSIFEAINRNKVSQTTTNKISISLGSI